MRDEAAETAAVAVAVLDAADEEEDEAGVAVEDDDADDAESSGDDDSDSVVELEANGSADNDENGAIDAVSMLRSENGSRSLLSAAVVASAALIMRLSFTGKELDASELKWNSTLASALALAWELELELEQPLPLPLNENENECGLCERNGDAKDDTFASKCIDNESDESKGRDDDNDDVLKEAAEAAEAAVVAAAAAVAHENASRCRFRLTAVASNAIASRVAP